MHKKLYNMIYLDMPLDLTDQLGKNERLTKEMAYSHSVSDSYFNHKFYCTMYNGKRYITSLEQKEQAQKLYEINKQKIISTIGNKLMFVGMGMGYQERYQMMSVIIEYEQKF